MTCRNSIVYCIIDEEKSMLKFCLYSFRSSLILCHRYLDPTTMRLCGVLCAGASFFCSPKSCGMVITYSERYGEVTEETSYFVINFLDPALFVYAKIIHLRIENKIHHPLDCVFNENRCRVRTGFGHKI